MKESILVFKTNIRNEADVRTITEVFDRDSITQWTVDTSDRDAVLRVVTTTDSSEEIIQSITNKGYLCSELTD
jgi:ribosomal protein S12 methylthiotransferase accessory factor YcaO